MSLRRHRFHANGRRPDSTGSAKSNPEDLHDLGFGSRVSEESVERLLNRDGSFNVERTGLSLAQSLNFYHLLLTMPWLQFYAALILAFVLINAIFGSAFVLCGSDALPGFDGKPFLWCLVDGFFFSVQTFTTVGYGAMSPTNLPANIVATADAFMGLLVFALATGLLFARFSRPTAKILYSETAVMAPFREIQGFMFRIANQRRSQLIEVEVKLLFSHLVEDAERIYRKYHQLKLERERVVFFPLHWTIVHPVDEESPLHGITEEDMRRSRAEFLILLTAVDDTFAQTVHSRSSYRYDEIVWNARFADPFRRDSDGSIQVDLKKMHEIEKVG